MRRFGMLTSAPTQSDGAAPAPSPASPPELCVVPPVPPVVDEEPPEPEGEPVSPDAPGPAEPPSTRGCEWLELLPQAATVRRPATATSARNWPRRTGAAGEALRAAFWGTRVKEREGA